MRWEMGDGNPNSLLHLRAVNLCVGGVFMKPPELVPVFLDNSNICSSFLP